MSALFAGSSIGSIVSKSVSRKISLKISVSKMIAATRNVYINEAVTSVIGTTVSMEWLPNVKRPIHVSTVPLEAINVGRL